MIFHQGPEGLETELPYGAHILQIPILAPILLFVDSVGVIVRHVFQGETVELAPQS